MLNTEEKLILAVFSFERLFSLKIPKKLGRTRKTLTKQNVTFTQMKVTICDSAPSSVLCFVDGAAMRAGVQTGDRIIKVRLIGLMFYILPPAVLEGNVGNASDRPSHCILLDLIPKTPSC